MALFIEFALSTIDFDINNREEVVNAMMTIVDQAEKRYSLVQKEYNKKLYEKVEAQKFKEFREEADKKYKRQKNKDAYYNKLVNQFLSKPLEMRYWGRPESLSFIDFSFNPSYSLEVREFVVNFDKNNNRETFEKIYDYYKDREYFKDAKGMSIIINIDENDSYIKSHFRPFAKLKLSKELQNQYMQEQYSFAEKMDNFRKETNYFGD